jgi:hypothetical protein
MKQVFIQIQRVNPESGTPRTEWVFILDTITKEGETQYLCMFSDKSVAPIHPDEICSVDLYSYCDFVVPNEKRHKYTMYKNIIEKIEILTNNGNS